MATIIDEGQFTHIYGMVYLLGHGESKVGPLSQETFSDDQLKEIDDFLASCHFREVMDFVNQCSDQMSAEWGIVNNLMVQCGMEF